MEFETILYEESDDHVATITINRPWALNAFSGRMCEEFEYVWQKAIVDEHIHAYVLRASMECRAFCTGVDVRGGRDAPGARAVSGPNETNDWFKVDPGEYLGPRANKMWKPVVTAVHGMCAGGAFYWVNESDIIICSEEATFFDPHVTYGMTAALEPIGATYRMPLGDVMRMALLGNDERIGSHAALRMGTGIGSGGTGRALGACRRNRRQDRRQTARRHPGHGTRGMGVARSAAHGCAQHGHVLYHHRQPGRHRPGGPRCRYGGEEKEI